MFPLTPELRDVLERQLARTREVEKATGRIIPWLFHHRGGRPITGFRRAWLTACRRAGGPGRIPHDFRRTAVRNLERAGVPRSAAMKMVGHRTESIYRRYAIVDEAMLREGAEKLALAQAAEWAKFRAKSWEGSPAGAAEVPEILVGWDGIEPPTPGFSVLCSTN